MDLIFYISSDWDEPPYAGASGTPKERMETVLDELEAPGQS